MTRWITLVVTLGALLLMIFGHSPGWIILGLIVFVFAGLATALAFAHARIASRTQSEDMAGYSIAHEHADSPRSGNAD